MTSASPGIRLDIARRRRRPERHWRRALRALRGLLDDPARTELAFEVARALDPEMHERALRRMLDQPEGRRVFAERPRLGDLLSDRAGLEALPDDSFGRAYLAHLDRHGLDPAKLVELGRARPASDSADPDVHWMAERSALAHDLWHVLTGYPADDPGESALLLFSLGQTGGASNALLAAGANLQIARQRGLGWIPYAWKAWRRGRLAVCLAALPHERLLPLPLAEVRAAAGIEPPERAHPGSIASARIPRA